MKAVPVVVALAALVLAGCGSSGSKTASPTTATSGSSASTGSTGTTGSTGASTGCAAADSSLDAQNGKYAGYMAAVVKCTGSKPLKATGTPITIGFENSQGDPAGTFPDFTAGVQAGVDYINNDLGGIGGNVLTGKTGRPIKLVTCFMTLNPSAATSCANQLAASKPAMVLSGINFFGSLAYPTFVQQGIPVVDFVPITTADFNGKDVYSIGAAGGCVGDLPPLEAFSIYKLHAKKLAIPYTLSSGGEECYADLQKKVVNIINGSYKPTPAGVQLVPSATQTGYGFQPGASGDLSSLASQILAGKPDAVMFAAQASDCFNVLSSLEGQGYSPKKTPMIMAGSCVDSQQLAQAGSKADGVYFVGAPYNLLSTAGLSGLPLVEIGNEISQLKKYAPSQAPTGFESQAFQSMMNLWLVEDQAALAGSTSTSAQLGQALASTSNVHQYAGLPWGCAAAVAPYASICSTATAVLQWSSTTKSFKTVVSPYSAYNIIKGTKSETTP